MTDVAAAEDIEGEEGEVVETAPKSRKKLFILIGAAVLVLLLGGGGAYFFLFAGGDDKAESLAAEMKPTYFFDLPTMTVNLNSDNDEFLKLSVALELQERRAHGGVLGDHGRTHPDLVGPDGVAEGEPL